MLYPKKRKKKKEFVNNVPLNLFGQSNINKQTNKTEVYTL